MLLFPAIGGLAARGRNGLARLLLIVALCFAYIASYAPLTVALFAGYLALSFCDLGFVTRTARELSWGAAALILLSPLIPALAPTVSAWIFHTRLSSLPAPYPSLVGGGGHFHPRQAQAHHRPWICDGQPMGFRTGSCRPQTPRALAFTVWYELGIVGAVLAAVGAWLAFRSHRARAGAARALYGRGLLGRRRARLPQCRFRRNDDR